MLADAGYQSLVKEHENAQTPTKKPKSGELTVEQRRANKELSRERIAVENVIGHLLILLMAWDGIEPPIRGYSDLKAVSAKFS